MTTKIGVAIVGASGYAARELIGILLNHPHVRDHRRDVAAGRSAAVGIVASQPGAADRPDLRSVRRRSDRRAGVFRLPGAAAHREHGRGSRLAPARGAGHRPERRLSLDRSPGLRRLVRPRAHRPRRPAHGRLRTARAVSRPDSARRSDRQPRLLHLGEHPGTGPSDRRGPDRAHRNHHRRQERSVRRGPFAQADVPLPRMQREPVGLQRRPAPAHARDRPGADRSGRPVAAIRSR